MVSPNPQSSCGQKAASVAVMVHAKKVQVRRGCNERVYETCKQRLPPVLSFGVFREGMHYGVDVYETELQQPGEDELLP